MKSVVSTLEGFQSIADGFKPTRAISTSGGSGAARTARKRFRRSRLSIYDERRAALLEAGFIETRELALRNPLSSGRAAKGFFWSFATNFPGVEMRLRQSVFVVTARKSDFALIELFISRYASEPAR